MDIQQGAARILQTSVQVLTPGATFAGRYRIIEELGKGGMGLVYKARDIRLDRFVAIKVLPREKVSDPGRKLRFVQEARAASSLNHANIIHIYDIEQAEGVDFIAMEYVDGQTLSDIIGRKGLKLDEALRLSIQIADALAVAHEAGIVHRDLKPGNVMVTGKGQAKILDFGLAKLTETLPAGQGDPTLTLRPATAEGTIVGTVAYMSPEQAEGKKVDARSDIFSFGSLLYEMVTGKRAFRGESSASTLAAILKDIPQPPGQVIESLPREVERLISRCLRKDVGQRFQHMADVKIALEELKEDSDSGALAATRAAPTRRSPIPRVAAIAVTIISLAAILWLWLGRSRPRPEATVTAIPLTSDPGEEAYPSFSPDGTQVAFEWDSKPVSPYHIYIKQIGVEQPVRLTDSAASETRPAWSPDGRFIAFRRDLSPKSFGIIIVPQRGGRERVLAELDASSITQRQLDGHQLAWTPDSKWIACSCPIPRRRDQGAFGGGNFWGLFLFSLETAEKKELTSPPEFTIGDTSPAFSPDGRFLVFTRIGDDTGLFVQRLSKGYGPLGEPERIRSDNPWNTGAAWLPDGREIVFASGTSRDDPSLWRTAVGTNGVPRRIQGLESRASMPAIPKQGGRLAFMISRNDSNIWRVDLAEPGRMQSPPAKFIASTQWDFCPVYSPDGRKIAFMSRRSGTQEIWVADHDGSNALQVTTLRRTDVGGPTFSPDGSRIAFHAATKEGWNIFVVQATGGPAKRLTSMPGAQMLPSWSRDGRSIYFIYYRVAGGEIWNMPAEGGEAVHLPLKEGDGVFESPDGKSLYIQRGTSGNRSIWKAPVGGGEEIKIFGQPSLTVLWAYGKKTIYFFAQPNQQGHSNLLAYELETGEIRKILTVERLLDYQNLTLSPNERTILFAQYDDLGSDLMLVENFK
jgi:serine/threonine protein kinase